jgi:hypothetical protein
MDVQPRRARSRVAFALLVGVALFGRPASAQFLDEFNRPSIHPGWTFFTGDGLATVEFKQGDGCGTMLVDATRDRANIWWALIKRDIASSLDVKRLSEPGHELRLELRIRVGEAPRRVHLQANTQKTVNFHEHLMEFDIPDTEWHTISWTTRRFRAEPGDAVNVQFAITDWGLGRYRADVDYFKVDVVDAADARPDLGVQVPYHPPIPDPSTLAEKALVSHDSMIDLRYPDVNLNNWYGTDGDKKVSVLTVNGAQFVIMRWDLRAYAGRKVAGAGLLELTTHSLQTMATEPEEFGQIRVTEILGGDPNWDQRTVTLDRLSLGQPLDAVLNPQMIIDERVAERRGDRTLITISRPVLQRLVDGRTLGLAIRPLGPIDATLYASEHENGRLGARLLFNVQKQQ